MSDRNYTFMIVPDKSKKVKRFSLPAGYIYFGAIGLILIFFGAIVIGFDYVHLQIQSIENKSLKIENRNLLQQIDKTQADLDSIEQSLQRVKNFASKLKIISNLDSPLNIKSLNPSPYAGEDFEVDESNSKGFLEGNTLKNKKSPSDKKPNKETKESSSIETPDTEELAFDSEMNIEEKAKYVNEQIIYQENNFALLMESLQDKTQQINHTPSIIPTDGWISSLFGPRHHPVLGRRVFHNGLDIANMPGTPIKAPANGKVVRAGNYGAMGNMVKIDHGYTIKTIYGHMKKVKVKKGQLVKRGDIIGEVGSSGRSTGYHLHYQVEVADKAVDPKFFILDRSI